MRKHAGPFLLAAGLIVQILGFPLATFPDRSIASVQLAHR